MGQLPPDKSGSLLPRFRSYTYKILEAVLFLCQLHICKALKQYRWLTK